MKSQSRQQLEMQSSEGFTDLKELLPNLGMWLPAVGLSSSPDGPRIKLLITWHLDLRETECVFIT